VTLSFDVNQLWTALTAAEKAGQRGTALLRELCRLLTRDDPLSKTWLEERRKLRASIEAHLAGVKDNEAETRLGGDARSRAPNESNPCPSAEKPSSSVKDDGDKEDRAA
jgi:hypothetical protein